MMIIVKSTMVASSMMMTTTMMMVITLQYVLEASLKDDIDDCDHDNDENNGEAYVQVLSYAGKLLPVRKS